MLAACRQSERAKDPWLGKRRRALRVADSRERYVDCNERHNNVLLQAAGSQTTWLMLGRRQRGVSCWCGNNVKSGAPASV